MGQQREEARKEESVSEGVAGAFRLGLATEIFANVETKSEADAVTSTVTVTQSGSGLPGGAPRLLLGFAPRSFINLGATLGFSSSTIVINIDGLEPTETETSTTVFGGFLELMLPSGTVRPYGRARFEVTGATSKTDDIQNEELNGSTLLVGAGLHIFPAELLSIDLGVDIGHASAEYGSIETSGAGVVGFLGVTGWIGAAGAETRREPTPPEESQLEAAGGAVAPRRAPERDTESVPPATPPSSEVVVTRENFTLEGGALLALRTVSDGTASLVMLVPSKGTACEGVALVRGEMEEPLPDVTVKRSGNGSRMRLSLESSVAQMRGLFDAPETAELSFDVCGERYPLEPKQQRRLLAALNPDAEQ